MIESIAKLRWACRRGMLELDVLLQHFLQHGYPLLSEDDQQQFVKLLTHPDPNLFSWLIGREPAPGELHEIISAIKQCTIKPLD